MSDNQPGCIDCAMWPRFLRITAQTTPLVLTSPVTVSHSNPFFRSSDIDSVVGSEPKLAARRAPSTRPEPKTAKSSLLDNNPFRTGQHAVPPLTLGTTSPPSTVHSPPLPPRVDSPAKVAPPRHPSQSQSLTNSPSVPVPVGTSSLPPSDGGYKRMITVLPASKNSINVIMSSQTQPDTSAGSPLERRALQPVEDQSTGRAFLSGALTPRLLGSSHIGVDSIKLRRSPSQNMPKAVDDGSHSRRDRQSLVAETSDNSLSSLAELKLPHIHQYSAAVTPINIDRTVNSVESNPAIKMGQRSDSMSIAQSAERSVPALPPRNSPTKVDIGTKDRPPIPPPVRRRPDSLYLVTNQSGRSQQLRVGVFPSHGFSGEGKQLHTRAMSASEITFGRTTPLQKPICQYSAGPHADTHRAPPRLSPVSAKSLDALLTKGKDVGHGWLEKARAGMMPTAPNRMYTAAEESESLIGLSEQRSGREAQPKSVRASGAVASSSTNSDAASSDSEPELDRRKMSVQERRRELEQMQTDKEGGWTRLA